MPDQPALETELLRAAYAAFNTSFDNMTAVTLDETFPDLNSVERGMTSLHNYLSQMVQSSERK